MKLPLVIATLLLNSLLFVAASVEAKEPPPFPGQPFMNSAFKHLNAAKEKTFTDAPGAIKELESASTALAHALHTRGTYQVVARQLTEQATRYLQAGDPDKAVHKIDDALVAVNRGADTSDRYKPIGN